MKSPLLAAVLLLLSPGTQAFYCFEPSPSYLRLGESYFDDSEQKIEVNGDEKGIAIVKRLRGEWDGSLSELICEGTQEAPEPYYQEAEVEAEVRESNTALFLISLSKTYDNSYISSGDKVFLMNLDSMHSLRISPDYIEATERERRAWHNRHGGSRYVEVHSQIQIHNEDTITVDWQLFSNGVFVYSQRLLLERGL